MTRGPAITHRSALLSSRQHDQRRNEHETALLPATKQSQQPVSPRRQRATHLGGRGALGSLMVAGRGGGMGRGIDRSVVDLRRGRANSRATTVSWNCSATWRCSSDNCGNYEKRGHNFIHGRVNNGGHRQA